MKAAAGGTLFLDEIGELPLEIQPKLLRLLQEREYERVGETITRRADVRIVAATNRDLKKRVAEGAFREDLFYRLNVITVEMPPLRDRPEDLMRFTQHYLDYFSAQAGRPATTLSEEAAEIIQRYPWPGNLRELRNAIERAVILASSGKLQAADMPAELRGGTAGKNGEIITAGSMITLERMEDLHIRSILEQASSLAHAAEILGIDQATLYRKRKKLGLE